MSHLFSQVRGLAEVYRSGEVEVRALDGVDMTLGASE